MFPNVTDSISFTTEITYSQKIDRIWGSIGLLCGAFTIIGNMFVFTILIRLPKRSLADFAFINLSIIDTISGFTAIAGSWFLLDDRTWLASSGVLHTVTCYMAGMTWNAASLTTPLLVSVVSIGRLSAVYLPLKYDKIFTRPVVYSMLIYCWLHGAVASSLSLLGDTGNGKYALYRGWGFCDQSIKSAYESKKTFTALYMTFFTLPMMLTCACIVFCNLLVMTRIIMMKIKPDPNVMLSEQTSTTKVMLTKIGNMGHQLSRVATVQNFGNSIRKGYNYKASTKDAQQELSMSTATTGAESSGYKHFEIVSLDNNSETHFNKTTGSSVKSSLKRRQSKLNKLKSFQKQKRAKRENRAIFMTFLVSVSYLICYMEIINFYTLASFNDSPRTLFEKVLGITGNPLVETYVYLWYYFSLFAAAATNVLLHLLFNHVVRNGLTAKGRKSREEMNNRSSGRSCMTNN